MKWKYTFSIINEENFDRTLEEDGPWDLSGSILDCLLRYVDLLSPEEIEEIIGGM